MQFLKGLATVSGAVFALLIATIVTFVLHMRAGSRPGIQTGWDIKVLWILAVNSPIYWLAVLVLIGLSVWVFKRWVLAH
jgi:hypothetical protein